MRLGAPRYARVRAWMSYAHQWIACENMNVSHADAAHMYQRFTATLQPHGCL